MSIEAMKQALEALEGIYIAPENLDYIADWWPACRDSIPALRQAIAEAEKQEPVATIRGFDGNGAVLEWRIKSTDFPAGTYLYTHPQPAQPNAEQEPKCNPHPKAPHGFDRNASHANDRYVCECEGWDAYEAGKMEGVRLTLDEWEKSEPSQPKREWVGLTDFEVHSIFIESVQANNNDIELIELIEAKLKEKNT